MAGYEKWITETGTEKLTVFSEKGKRWIGYQSEMVKKGDVPVLLEAEGPAGEEILEYDLSLGRAVSGLASVTDQDLEEIIGQMSSIPDTCREYLLEEGGCLAEMSCLFWNPERRELRGIYIPELSGVSGEEWVKNAARNLLETAVEARWPEEQVAACYRFYLGEPAEPEDLQTQDPVPIAKKTETKLSAAEAFPFPEITWEEPEKPYEKGWQWFRNRFGRQGAAARPGR